MPKEYFEKLKDPRWQKKRLEIFERDEWKCCVCGDKKSTLHVHHTCYIKGKNPWEYEEYQLVTLCEGCHEAEHTVAKKEFKKLITAITERGFIYKDIMDFFWVFKAMFINKELFDVMLKTNKDNMLKIEKHLNEEYGSDND